MSKQQTLLDLDSRNNYPMLIEYDGGGQDIVTCSEDIPINCCFYILQTKYVLEGRIITGSCQTRQ